MTENDDDDGVNDIRDFRSDAMEAVVDGDPLKKLCDGPLENRFPSV
jgi:hypothetical protein